MREVYHEELSSFRARLVELTQSAHDALVRATRAVLDTDRELAELVIADDQTLAAEHHELDQRAIGLLARQQPVARDLRLIVAGLRMSADLARMGTLARHVAELAAQRYPSEVVPGSLRPTITAMGAVAGRLAGGARDAMLSWAPDAAAELDRDDDELDHLQALLYRQLLSGAEGVDIATAMDVTLLGRYYERYADHAVSLAKRVSYVAGARVRSSGTGRLGVEP
ncbi:phosphate signaling complex protein PhoU [Prauserella flavalba]|uniref:Phosphate-specific transport system accessory protein PhoU n=1 Tax=Prauserella flavalba TaxID=1477506 RepID=A0A318LSC4_9PSEU|nr:phosphate signaling complex protein PhoU [Prauserella flavalba]PXY36510.1 phosphate transport system regulatory protein PhoU [Prauserella flavalba]